MISKIISLKSSWKIFAFVNDISSSFFQDWSILKKLRINSQNFFPNTFLQELISSSFSLKQSMEMFQAAQ